MGRVRSYIQVNGRKCWTLFDSGAENTYVLPDTANLLQEIRLPHVWKTRLAGRIHRIARACHLVGTVQGKPMEVEAYVINEIGTDKRSKPPRPFEILFGAFAMQKWGIGLDFKREKLDMSGYSREFVEFSEEPAPNAAKRSGRSGGAAPPAGKGRPYEKPTIKSEGIFETSALVSCAKLPGQGPCAGGQKDS